jgi:pimeloyl-ACP methyl ester carboxylesterase
MLFIHGLASNASTFQDCADMAVSKGHSVCTVDLGGHGLAIQSSKNTTALGVTREDSDFGIHQYILDLVFILRYLEITYDDVWNMNDSNRSMLLLGHSYGGNLALQLAQHHLVSACVSGVVCIDGGYINLSKKYSTVQDCCSALIAPHFGHFTHQSLESLVRSTWCVGWPENGTFLLKRFGFRITIYSLLFFSSF